jgi:hypothetical protein
MKIDVQITELILHGRALSDRSRIAGAVQTELARLFAERGVPPGALACQTHIGRLGSAVPHLTQQSGAGGVGIAVARAIYGGLSDG